MKITALVENTTNNTTLKQKHGLSIHIETDAHKILFDVGPDNTILDNAEKLGIDLSAVDTVVISHGHMDHGGALSRFLERNDHARIYIRRNAFEPHFSKVMFLKIPVGLNRRLVNNDRFVFVDDALRIDSDMLLFSDVEGQFDTQSNRALYAKTDRGYGQDSFTHEQSLVVTEGGKAVLFSGCSHRGILNILRAASKHQPNIEAVFGGFHLFNPVTKKGEPASVTRQLAKDLVGYNAAFYTCHCTGQEAYAAMRASMGEKLHYFSTGMTVVI